MPVADRHFAEAENHYEAAERLLQEERHGAAHKQFRLAAEAYGRTHYPNHEHQAWLRAGLCAATARDLDEGLSCLAEALAIARQHGLERELGRALSHLGELQARRGAAGEAATAYHEALFLAERGGEQGMLASVAGNLGLLELNRGDLPGGRSTPSCCGSWPSTWAPPS